MALETATYIDGLVATNPAASDAINTADDHLRLIKSAIKATFPNITAAVTKTAAQVNDLLEKSGGTMTGTLVLAGAPSSNLHAATKAYVDTTAAAAFPSGGIIMWSGTIAAIPSGWLLCNGSNGTPDLRDRFIIGARQDDAGAAKTNVTGSLTQTGGSKDAIVVSHTHTATSTVTDPGHVHGGVMRFPGSQVEQEQAGGPESRSNYNQNTDSASTGITVSTTVASAGSSGTNANLPPYYALAFIMKA